MRIVPGSRDGIRIGQSWYCSEECFSAVARATVSELASLTTVDTPSNPRLSLGLVLVAKGYLTAEQIRTATNRSRWLREDLDTTLLRMRLVSERQLAAARSAQWGLPVLFREHIHNEVQTDIPRSMLTAFSAVPLHYSASAKRVLLGFASRVDHSFLEAIERVTGCRTLSCFITATDFAQQMEKITGFPDHTEVLINEPDTPGEMAATICRSAARIAATEAEFAHCRGHIWARLVGEQGKVDVICRLRNAGKASSTQNGDVEKTIVNLG